MSLIIAYKDYIDFINNIAQHISNGADNQKIPAVLAATEYIQATAAFSFELLKSNIQYIISFHWLRDFVNLPILLPKLYESLYLEKFIGFNSNNDFISNNISQNYLLNYFETLDFWEDSLVKDNKFIIGFFNSFFLTLPFSVSQIINARRLLVQGRLAGISSISGTIIGQWLFLFCVVYGLRWPLLPLLELQQFFTIFTVFILVNIFYQMWRKIIVNYSWSTLSQYFVLNIFLAWTEQTAIFQYLTNLSVSPNPSAIEVTTSTSNVFTHTSPGIPTFQFGENISYLFGIGLGQIIFAFLIWHSVSALYYFVEYQFFRKTPSFLTIRTNRILVVILLTMNIMIIPFYGIDYWITNPLGFVSQDKTFWYKTYIPGEQYRKWRLRHPNSRRLDRRRDEATKERGLYMSQYQRKLNGKRASESFEKLNYGAENAWYRRRNTKQAFRRRFVKTLGLRTAFAKILTGKERRSKNTPEGRKAIAILIEARVKFLKKQLQKTNKFKLKYQKTTLPNLINPNKLNFAGNEQENIIFRSLIDKNQNILLNDLNDNFISKNLNNSSSDLPVINQSVPIVKQEDIFTEKSYSKTPINSEQINARNSDFRIYKNSHFKNHQGKSTTNTNFVVDRLQHKFKYYPRKTKLTKLNWYTFTRRGLPPRKTRVNKVRQILNRNRKLFYYYQPVTQVLLNTKIDTFLARQPKTYLLKNVHEKNLFQRRVLLSRYYDSLLDYSKLSSYFSFSETTGGARTFAHRAYKHQFKGTLRVVRRLFSINYKTPSPNTFLLTGKKTKLEDVVVGNIPNKDNEANEKEALLSYQSNRVLQFDQPLYTRKSHTQNPLLHEELEFEQNHQQIENKPRLDEEFLKKQNVPLLTDTKPVPYYAGWDADLREFYITNRYMPKVLSGKLIDLPNWDQNTLAKEYNISPKKFDINDNDKSLRINFQFWPISPHNVNWAEPDSISDEVTNKNSDQSLIDKNATRPYMTRPYYMSVFPVEKFKDRFVDKESIIQQFGLEPELSPEEEQRINIILKSSTRNNSSRKRNSSSQNDQSSREQQKQERAQEIHRLIRLKWKQRGFNYKTVPTTVLKVGAKEPSFKGLARGGLIWPGSYKPPSLNTNSRIDRFLEQLKQKIQNQKNNILG